MKRSSYFFLVIIIFISVYSCKDSAKDKEEDTVTSMTETVLLEEDSQSTITLLSSSQFDAAIHSNDKILLLDVRTPEEFETGFISGAVNIDFNDSNFATAIKSLDAKVPVYLYCKSGGRSGRAASVLQEMGFTEIYDLEGGITSWTENELPIEK